MTIAVTPPRKPVTVGNQAEYELGCVEGWGAFEVVRWHAREELSRPFQYEIVLRRDPLIGAVDIDALVDTGATLRIAASTRQRLVHGIIAEAEEIERTPTMILYRVLLVPHFWRAKYRQRCRTYMDKSIAEVVAAVLENDLPEFLPDDRGGGVRGLTPIGDEARPGVVASSSFVEPSGYHRIAVADEAFHDRKYRYFLVQYNESDFQFVSRLLEESGVTYWFEHAEDGLIMHMTDRPGADPVSPADRAVVLRGATAGSQTAGEVLRSMTTSRRMRSRALEVWDYDEERPRAEFFGERYVDQLARQTSEHLEFRMFERYSEAIAERPAQFRLERFEAERRMAQGRGGVRTMEPGRRFVLQDADALRPDQELLIVAVESYAAGLAPQGTVLDDEPFGFPGTGPSTPRFEMQVTVLPSDVPFRPALAAPKPRIHGVQQARVSARELAEESRPEIWAEDDGSVRVYFPWDMRPNEPGVPSSPWLFVSQAWAGEGYGAVFTPRVGTTVLVSFYDGDPEFPVIVGRVHNREMPCPTNPATDPTVSVIRSRSTPGSDGYTHILIDDEAGEELLELRAQRDFRTEALRNATSIVGVDQRLKVGGKSSVEVAGPHSFSAAGVSISTGAYKLGAKTVDASARTTMTLTAGDVRTDKSNNHIVKTGGFWVEGTSTAQLSAPQINLIAGGSSITLTHGGIEIKSSGDITVNGAVIKLNC